MLHCARLPVVEADSGDDSRTLCRPGDLPALHGPAPHGLLYPEGFPASAAASAISLCRKFGAQIDTTSTSGWFSTSR